jgi:hypothetical protein
MKKVIVDNSIDIKKTNNSISLQIIEQKNTVTLSDEILCPGFRQAHKSGEGKAG